MGQVTIYLEDSLERKARRRAKAEGIPLSKWIAGAVDAKETDEWPAAVLEAFGTWNDVPDQKAIRARYAKDAKREVLD